MSPRAKREIPVAALDRRVLRVPPDEATPQAAASAVESFLRGRGRDRAPAASVHVAPGMGAVILSAEGEDPEAALREVERLLRRPAEEEAIGEIEVDPEEFAIEPGELPPEQAAESEVLRSDVRYFPYPECQWYEIASGQLVLSRQRLAFEPEVVIADGGESAGSKARVIRLSEIREAYRGDWWDVPCLMIETAEQTWRFGWPARRGELQHIFDVDEWLMQLRSLLQEQQ